jgi:hypothetical protein
LIKMLKLHGNYNLIQEQMIQYLKNRAA